MAQDLETAVLGGGCFWCTEALFQQIKGIEKVASGYAGGDAESPTYEQVCSGSTGHAEVIKIEFDPNVISYEKLLEIFFATHNPTTPNQQGADMGSQYRSIILYANEEQEQTAEKVINGFAKEHWKDPIVTELKPLEKFYPAEDYHQNYFKENPSKAYCQLIINPKLKKFQKEFKNYLK